MANDMFRQFFYDVGPNVPVLLVRVSANEYTVWIRVDEH